MNIDKIGWEMRWQPWLALAVLLVGIAACCGIILGLAHLLK